MYRALLFVAAFVTLVPATLAQTHVPPEAEPRPSPPRADGAVPKPPAPPETPTPKTTAVPRGSVLEEVSGTVRDIDRKEHRLTVDTGAGATVALSLDRNTMVYTPAGLGTVLDISVGAQIRAGRNADMLAYWVQVRGTTAPQAAASQATSSTPAQPTRDRADGAPGASTPAGPAPSGTTPPAGASTGR